MIKKKANSSPKNKETKMKQLQSDITMTNIQKQFMLVAVRIRPMIEKETVMSNIDIVKTQEGANGIITIVNPLEYQQTLKGTNYLQNQKNIEITKSKEYQFSFDEIFNNNATQEDIYNYSSFLLQNALDGYNSTILAYGTTGTGKTYSMVGNGNNPGIMVRTVSDIFNILNDKNSKQFSVQISYIEIYNEILTDLLSDNVNHLNVGNNKEGGSAIEIRTDPTKGVILVGAITKNVQTASEAFTLLIKGNKKRREDATNLNEYSSRSHAVLQILLEQKNNSQEDNNNTAPGGLFGKYLLVDLAGSEKVAKQTTESGSINKSLLALTNCINAIINNKAGSFVPWRDSKLTRILKDALNGNSRALMLTTISPSVLSLEETLYTLQFASRAKNVKIMVKKNEVPSSYHISKYDQAIQALQKDIAEMKNQIAEKSLELNNNNSSDHLIEPLTNSAELEKQFIDMKNHFEDEVQHKKRILAKEKEAADFKLNIAQSKNKILFQDPKTTKAKVKEIAEMENKLTQITNEINDLYTKQSSLVQKRKLFQKLIEKIAKEDEQKKDSGAYLYSHSFMNSYKYHISLLKNMSSEARNYVDMIELKLKNEQIAVLYTQLEYRDNAIVQVNKQINNPQKESKVSSFVSSEEIKLDPCLLPALKKATRNASEEKFNAVEGNSTLHSNTQREQTGTLTVLKPVIMDNIISPSRKSVPSSPFIYPKQKYTPIVKVYKKSNLEITPIKSGWISANKFNPLTNNRYLHFLDKVKNQPMNTKNQSFIKKDRSAECILTNTSKLEKEIKKNLKTIFRKDIIGRYKNSPYSFSNLNH